MENILVARAPRTRTRPASGLNRVGIDSRRLDTEVTRLRGAKGPKEAFTGLLSGRLDLLLGIVRVAMGGKVEWNSRALQALPGPST